MFNNISDLRVYLLLTCTILIAVPQTSNSKELQDYLPQIEQTGGWYITESAVVSGSDVKAGVVYAVIDASHDHLVSILREYNRYHELIPFLSHSTLIKRHSARTAQLRLKAKILKGALKLNAIVDVSETNESPLKTTFNIRKTNGNLKRLDTKFTVQQLSPARSILRIELMLDPDVWYVRDRTLTDYNQVNARRIARALNKRIQQRPAPLVVLPKVKQEQPAATAQPTPQAPTKMPEVSVPAPTSTRL